MIQGELIVEVQSGVTDRPSVSLRPGEPLEPLSIGRNAFWQVLAEGVSSVHAFIYFDGDAVFVASADMSNPAVAAGALVGGDWTEVFPPCEIRLGHAVLLLRDAAQTVKVALGHSSASDTVVEHPAEMDFDEGELSTAKVDGRHLEAEHRKRKPRVSVPDDDEPTRMADPPTVQMAKRKSRRKPKIRVPRAEEATLYRPLAEPETTPWRESELSDPSPQRFAQQQVATEPGPFPAVVMPRVLGDAPVPVQQPVAGPMPAKTQPILPTTPGFVPPGVGQAPAWSGQPAPIGAPGAMPAVNPLAKTSPDQTSRAAAQAAAAKNPTVAKVLEAWKQASIPQKAILCLLPFAFVAVLLMFGDDEPEAPRKKPKPQATAIVSASALPTASTSPPASTTSAASAPPSTAAPVASAKPPPSVAPNAAADKGPHATSGKGAPPRSLERQASDAVAAGSFSEALKVYEQLAAEHPDMPVYKEAVRILKGKMAETK
ncbi:MAG: hypothetical protein HY898_33990 [Deltaproteobacteria bacterium]|nr:hypothetical protein [Deltaproteobacteria bacterium]